MKVFVGNLSKQISAAQLKDLATPYGKLVASKVAIERIGGASKGFGFIEFTTPEEGRAAIAGLNGRDVNGQELKVNEAKRKEATPSQN